MENSKKKKIEKKNSKRGKEKKGILLSVDLDKICVFLSLPYS